MTHREPGQPPVRHEHRDGQHYVNGQPVSFEHIPFGEVLTWMAEHELADHVTLDGRQIMFAAARKQY